MGSTISDNQAAWMPAAYTRALEVRPGPDQSNPQNDDVVIQVAAVAINPTDWKMQEYNYLNLQYPTIEGSDAAGVVVAVGPSVTRFQPGDRVIGHCVGIVQGGARHGAFQKFAACRQVVVAKIPDNLSFERAVVLPLSLSTSIVGLYEHLKLRMPSSSRRLNTGSAADIVLIWGGASSMGSTAIQLAVASGYSVVTTASPRNHEYVRNLSSGGASIKVFDYSKDQVAGDILDHIKNSGASFAGAYDCVSTDASVRACAEIVHHLGGGLIPVTLKGPEGLPEDVTTELAWATNPALVPGHVGGRVWADFVPEGLHTGALKAFPEPKVVGSGLDQIQKGVDLLRDKGASAEKMVVTL